MALALTAAPAAACGGLVGENGTIQLTRTTTLAAYHDGVERYVTSFEFTGQGKEVGSIVPLPDVPTKVERGGDWTLQRLEREVAPPVAEAHSTARKAVASAARRRRCSSRPRSTRSTSPCCGAAARRSASGRPSHGFLLTPDAPEMLDFYADRSPIFMAARFDASRAQQPRPDHRRRHADHGDDPDRASRGCRCASSASVSTQAKVVEADVFLLTDDEPKLLAGGRGLSLDRNEPANASLLADLRSDKGMGWIPQHDVVHVPAARRAGRRSRLRPRDQHPARTRCRRCADAGVTASEARADHGARPGARCGRSPRPRRVGHRDVRRSPGCSVAGAVTSTWERRHEASGSARAVAIALATATAARGLRGDRRPERRRVDRARARPGDGRP